jgi:hypothetical protein
MTKEETLYKKKLEKEFGDNLDFKRVKKLANGNWNVKAVNKHPVDISPAKLVRLLRDLKKKPVKATLTISI